MKRFATLTLMLALCLITLHTSAGRVGWKAAARSGTCSWIDSGATASTFSGQLIYFNASGATEEDGTGGGYGDFGFYASGPIGSASVSWVVYDASWRAIASGSAGSSGYVQWSGNARSPAPPSDHLTVEVTLSGTDFYNAEFSAITLSSTYSCP